MMPKVALCGCPRSGTSMMMYALQRGGLTIDVDDGSKNIDQMSLFFLRNPYGIFESKKLLRDGTFQNSIKCAKPDFFTTIQSRGDYKFIFIYRPLADILDSCQRLSDRYESKGGQSIASSWKANSVLFYDGWQQILTDNPGLFLMLDYDTVCQNPAQMAIDVAQHINTEDFIFNQEQATLAVDINVYEAD